MITCCGDASEPSSPCSVDLYGEDPLRVGDVVRSPQGPGVVLRLAGETAWVLLPGGRLVRQHQLDYERFTGIARPWIAEARALVMHPRLSEVLRALDDEHLRLIQQVRQERELLGAQLTETERALETMRLTAARQGADQACIVCCTRPRNTLILPCAHLLLCGTCMGELLHRGGPRCPQCRGPIHHTLRIYL